MKLMSRKKADHKHDEADSDEEDEVLPGFNFGEFVTNKKHADLILMAIACNVTGSF